MKGEARIGILFILLAQVALVIVALAMVVRAQEAHWGYEGESGPEYWGGLSEEFALCESGRAQSPVNLVGATAVELVGIEFNYGESTGQIVNNGHTIQINVAEGNDIVYNEITYDLLQFHFHHPAEHTVEGQAAPLEAHFVHQDRNSGNLAVVGIMLHEGVEENETWATVFDQLPQEVDASPVAAVILNLADFLPENRAYYTYQGSLTTPPCSEIVRWLILDEAVEVSAAQIEAFAAIFSGNARPTQPLGRRDLQFDSR